MITSSRAPSTIGHGINGVQDEIHHHLLQLHAISHDPRKICVQLRSERNEVSRCLPAQENNHLPNDFVDVNQLPLGSTLLEEQPNPADDLGRTCLVLNDSHRGLTRLFDVGSIPGEPAQASPGIGEGGCNRLIHLVRDRGSKFAHRDHAVRVGQVRLCLAQPLFSLFAVFDVGSSEIPTRDASLFIS